MVGAAFAVGILQIRTRRENAKTTILVQIAVDKGSGLVYNYIIL